MRITTENLLLYILLLLISAVIQTCNCTNPRSCTPSACGIIRNISFPFRLKNDPQYCGHRDYEIECENNATAVLYINSLHKYRVKAINYNNFTIRLTDVSVNNNTCSLYRHITKAYPYDTFKLLMSNKSKIDLVDVAWPISLMRCPYPSSKKNFVNFTELPAHCDAASDSNSSAYIKIGQMKASEVGDMCRVEVVVLTSWNFKDVKNVSLSEIHQSLVFGFELSWEKYPCSKCRGSRCSFNVDNSSFSCYEDTLLGWLHYKWANLRYYFELDGGYPRGQSLLIVVVISVVLFTAANLPARIIIVIASALGILIFADTVGFFYLVDWLFFAFRYIVALPCMMWFLMYKFRRRHSSRYDVIEDFLQSDNHLVPIRHSYSDIKKMTKGFQQELGQGGYGTVYKGKLRSGYDVAVKLLGRPGGNDQDFMNEIATIGRIHHVNVVNLVGYCAERSKRALVFDFMPNGSLNKYIIGQENMNSLTWERKYEIAVGVARGIEYLHRGCNIQILHFDIKPHNILLDDKFIPKISDFGLAKYYSTEKNTVTLTAARGTIGYVAPELMNRGFGGVSYKADVYSFGMVLMEMVGLKRDLIRNEENSSQYFPYWIYDHIEQDKDIEFQKAYEKNDDYDIDGSREIAKKMTIVALWCIQMNPSDRPSMNKVVEMLEGRAENLQVPNRPSQLANVAVNYEDQSWSTYSTDSTSLLRRDAASSIEITVED